MAVLLVYCHDSNVCKSVFIAVKVFRHRRFFSPPVRNVQVVVDPAYQYLLFDELSTRDAEEGRASLNVEEECSLCILILYNKIHLII